MVDLRSGLGIRLCMIMCLSHKVVGLGFGLHLCLGMPHRLGLHTDVRARGSNPWQGEVKQCFD
jgi:hypothetical protein